MSTFADLGRYLTQQRELRGMSRDDIARATRIPPTLVAALEDGVADRLPERVFVVNYVRSYATAVGLSADEAVNRFHEIPGTLAPTEASPVTLEKARRKNAWGVVVILAIVLLGAGLALWLWTRAQLDASGFSSHIH